MICRQARTGRFETALTSHFKVRGLLPLKLVDRKLQDWRRTHGVDAPRLVHAAVDRAARLRLGQVGLQEDELLMDLGRTDAERNAANFVGLVLGCIEATVCKKLCVGKLSPRSTQCTPLHSSVIAIFCQKIAKIFANFCKIQQN